MQYNLESPLLFLALSSLKILSGYGPRSPVNVRSTTANYQITEPSRNNKRPSVHTEHHTQYPPVTTSYTTPITQLDSFAYNVLVIYFRNIILIRINRHTILWQMDR